MTVDLNHCVKECTQCILQYKEKHRLKSGAKFKVQCSGILTETIPEHILSALGVSENSALAMMDPVVWAAEMLDWHCIDLDGEKWKKKDKEGTLKGLPSFNEERAKIGKSIFHRPYQYQMLQCTASRKVFRLGRQCLSANSLIQLDNGTVKSIRDIKPGDRLLSLNTETMRNELDEVTDAWSSGKKLVYKIKTKFGHEITCTDTHPFFCISENLDYVNGYTACNASKEWKTISNGLSVGHKIAVPIYEETFGHKALDDNIPKLLGYFITDGSSPRKQSAKFTNNNKQYLQEFTALCSNLGSAVNPYPKKKGFDLIITNGSGQPNPVRDLLRKYNLVDITGPQKRVPKEIFTALPNQIRDFINRFWAGGGYIRTFQKTGRKAFRTEIGVLRQNKLLLEDIQRLLWRFGVHGYIKKEENSWRYVVSNKISVFNFLTNIGPVYGKEAACDIALKNIDLIKDSYTKTEENVLWDDISSIEYVGEEETYDIEVKKNHNFISNGIYTHNCGKTESICIAILFHVFTKENFHVEIIAPYQSQVDIIFKRLGELIDGNTILSNSIARNVKAPQYVIGLKNGSQIIGFTAGTRSGQKAGASRGQHANMLVFDEADMLSPEDIDAALAVIINHPEAIVWMSSTPTGKREKFFDSCHSLQYKEFHFPSQANPNWTEEHEEYFKSELTEDGYKHEILAEFGDQEEGVYQVKYVEAAQTEFEYGQLRPNASWCYCIGVDWNDTKIGTTIAVVGLNPQDNKFYLVDTAVISRAERTQLSACQHIAELNRRWRPDYIYVDAGYGCTQVEVLHDYGNRQLTTEGHSHPDARLREIVKAFDFGSSVEVYDLFTKQPTKKPAKPFLIENSVRRFESYRFCYPASDKSLTAQLMGYVVDRVSNTGRPIYKARNETAGDHLLDAVNLALVAFTLEKSKLGKPSYSQDIVFAPRFGETLTGLPFNEEAKKYKPQEGRAKVMSEKETFPSENGETPASKTVYSNQDIKVWAWPGWGHDAPRPVGRPLADAISQARNRIFGRNSGRQRPQRNKI